MCDIKILLEQRSPKNYNHGMESLKPSPASKDKNLLRKTLHAVHTGAKILTRENIIIVKNPNRLTRILERITTQGIPGLAEENDSSEPRNKTRIQPEK